MGEECIHVSDGEAQGMIPLGKPRSRRENFNKLDVREIEWGGMDLIRLAQDCDK
jgi:hypothetical protein